MIKIILKLLQKGGLQVTNLPIFDKIKGYKTLIISTLTIVIGAAIYLQEQLHGELGTIACNLGITFLCNVAGSKFYGSIIILIGFLNKILRLVTSIPVPNLTNNESETK